MVVSRLIGLAFLGFVGLGVPKAAFGTAWPSIAEDLDREIAELGVALVVYIAGYFVASVASGEVIRRIGLGRALVISGGMGVLALAGYTVAGRWAVLLAAAVVLGLSGGLVDAGINAWVAVRHTTRVMGFLHASFGIGATVGPLLMTVVLGIGITWRWGYLVMTVAQAALTVGFWVTRSQWDISDDATPGFAQRLSGRLRPGTLVGLVVFFLYSGVEIGAGQWAFSLLVEGRGYGDASAGLLVTAYWGALTAGRVALGIAGDRFSHGSVLRTAIACALLGLIALWWDPLPGAAAGGLVLAGLGLAPIFPLMMRDTAARLGADYAPWAVGYQLAAATFGAAVIPGGLGVAVARLDLEVIPPVLVAATIALAMSATAGRILHTPPAAT